MKWPNIIGLHTMFWLSVAGLLVYIFLSLFVPGQFLLTVTTSLNLGVSVAVIFTWGPSALYVLQRKVVGRNQLILAVVTVFATFLFARSYTALYTAMGQPDGWPDAAIRGLFGYLIFCCGLLFLFAPSNIEYPEVNYKIRFIWATVLGVIASGISYWAQTSGWLN